MAISDVMTQSELEDLLHQVETRRETIRTQVRSVCEGRTTASFFWGPGGKGKSHIILGEMEAMMGKGWMHHVAVTTPKGLFLQLMESPDSIHVYEDCEDMYKHAVAANILRAACGEPRGTPRRITYESAHEKHDVAFTGGVIIVSNENLSRTNGPLMSVASRFKPVKWDLNQRELMACIIDVASQGWERKGRSLIPAECAIVAERLIGKMTSGEGIVGIDMRVFIERCLPAYRQWLDGDKKVHWHDIIDSFLQGEVVIPECREERNVKYGEIALEISKMEGKIDVKHARWKELTGRSTTQYHIHLKREKAKLGLK